MVIHDCQGLVMASCALRYQAVFSVEMAEAIALLRGLKLTAEIGLHPIILESDSVTVVQLIRSKSHVLSELGLVMHEIFNIMLHVPVNNVCVGPVMANKVAHDLANFALTMEDKLVWIEDFPFCIEASVMGNSQ
ncbi:hypothetical protein ACOSQ4_011200 [Xanthoceras sorbifolium]